MSNNNKKLTDFTKESSQRTEDAQSNQNDSVKKDNLSAINNTVAQKDIDESSICESYVEIKNKYEDDLNKLGFTPPECGYCIEYLCESVSSGSAESYKSPLREFISRIHQEGICIKDVEYIDVRNYFESRSRENLARSTIAMGKSAITGVISRYEAEHKDFPEVSWKISENIDPKDYSVGDKYERVPLNDEEITKLLDALDDFRNKLLALTGMELGPRAEATCLIKVSDVDLEEKKIELKNTKSGGKYELPLTDDLASLLNHWIKNIRSSYLLYEDNPYLFPSRHGGRLSRTWYRGIINNAANRADIQESIGKIPDNTDSDNDFSSKMKVDVHALRHTFSRLMKEQDISKETRVYAMDHSRDVTDGYGIDKDACIEELRKNFNGVNISAR